MPAATTRKKLQEAMNHFQAGDLAKAAAVDQEVLKSDPNNAEAWHLSGMINFNAGQVGDSQTHLRKAIQLQPDATWFKTNLARVLIHVREYSEAETLCSEVLEAEPQNTIALANLGTALRQLNRRSAALEIFEKASQIERSASALCNEATVLVDLGRFDEALDRLSEAEKLDPNMWEIQKNLAIVLKEIGKQEEVEKHLQIMELKQPKSADVHELRGTQLLDEGHVVEAIEAYQEALSCNPESPDAIFGLGCALLKVGAWPESLEAFRLAALLEPERAARGSAMLYAASLCGHLSPTEIVQLHKDWGRNLEAVTPTDTLVPDVSTGRPIRIGYVSPDFRSHATMSFLYPLLRSHDRSAFEFVLYSETGREDEKTESVRQLGDEWRFTRSLSDDELAAQIRDDRIDILIDLAGHSADNRLPVFARKPAPVQVSFLGYPTTTGLSRIDYFLTDSIREPGDTVQLYSETPVLLPRGACCFEPSTSPNVAPPPCVANGFVTLGSTHRIEKLSDEAIAVWAATLAAIPNARLLIFRDSLHSESHRLRVAQRLQDAGADLARIDFAWDLPESHLNVYERFDILLDVFPWGSGTIAYDAMWMGVPIPTIRGDRAGCRATASLLHHSGFSDLIADNKDKYVQLMLELSNDLERLQHLRTHLRPALKQTVCNSERFAKDIEAAYQTFWNEYRTSQSPVD